MVGEIANIHFELNHTRISRAVAGLKAVNVRQRVEYIRGLVPLLVDNKEKIALSLTRETGKPFYLSLQEVDAAIYYTQFIIDNGESFLRPDIIERDNGIVTIVNEPLGLALIITPWNYPLLLALWGILPNLIAGNVVIFKPSDKLKQLNLIIVNIFMQLHLPEDSFFMYQGGREVVEALLNLYPDLLFFIGSSKVGQTLLHKLNPLKTRVVMELGGADAAVINRDVKITPEFIDSIFNARFMHSGQICSAVKRLFVHRELYSVVLEVLIKKLGTIEIGDPFNIETRFSGVISAEQVLALDKVTKNAVEAGCKVFTTAKENAGNFNYYPYTIIYDINNYNIQALKEEIFGPILPVISFSETDELIEMVNSSEYGLGLRIFSSDEAFANLVIDNIKVGRVGYNTINLGDYTTPSGGTKDSGFGKMHGRLGFLNLTHQKSIFKAYPQAGIK